VSASRGDVHPIAAIEALSFGLPVIITEESDFPEIDTFEAGKTTESNESSICDSIKDLLKNQDKLSTYSENALRLVEEKFLLENQIEKYENMFSKAITKK
jgi:glycosyltransferase involved in cell wall biosynthesis